MQHFGRMFIDGEWIAPSSPRTQALIDPATEQAFATISMTTEAADVDRAVAAARRAFPAFRRPRRPSGQH